MKSKLLLSASFAALTVGLSAGVAYATPPNPNNSPIPVAVIDTTVNGDFTNNSIIGSFNTETGLYLDGGFVSGDIVNNGYIRASETGVRVNDGSGTVSGAIVNKVGGHITASTASGTHARGVYEDGQYISHQDVQNSGDIIAKAANDWGDAFGDTQWVRATGVGQYIDDEGGPATNNVDNTGMIVASASSYMNGGDISSYAGAAAIEQEIQAYTTTATNTVTNGKLGLISANAVAHATAYGAGEDAHASAYATGVYQSVEYVDHQGSNILTNDGSINVTAKSFAQQVGGTGDTASASAQAFGVRQHAYDGSQLTDSVKNTGLISASASAYAEGTLAHVGTDNFIDTTAGGWQVRLPSDIAVGVYQEVSDAYTGLATLDNSGWINAQAAANGYGDTINLNAAAVGVLQYVTNVDYGTAYVHNEAGGYISAQASASGYAFDNAHAQATAQGVFQIVDATHDAYATVVNDGQIRAQASATAWTFGNIGANASASALAIGVDQLVVAEQAPSAFAHVQNSGEIYATASAVARGATDEFGTRVASAVAVGVEQVAQDSAHVSATVVNDGLIYAEADAYAGYNYGDSANPFGKNSASAVAIGVEQIAAITQTGEHNAILSVNNGIGGYISAFASAAAATANNEGSGTAQAHALAIGIEQQFWQANPGAGNHATVVNDGYIGAFATANVVDPGTGLPESNFLMGSASATAAGIFQHRGQGVGTEFDFSVDNSGRIFAAAEAYASTAHAYAAGIMAGDPSYLDATGSQEGVSINLKQTNEESGYITAQAVAGGVDAVAVAVGIADRAGTLGGTVENLGHIYASAFASASASGGYVRAVGIDADANHYDNLTIENKGTIVAYVNANPGDLFAGATGILLEPYDNFGDGGSALVVNDGGTIFAGIGDAKVPNAGDNPVMTSNGNGKYFNSSYEDYFNRSDVVRGNAINVAGLTSEQGIEIDLKGTDRTGNIYGNILLGNSGNDPLIVVSNGLTRFNGVIEPTVSFDPTANVTAPYTGSGTLNIRDGGTFKLVLNQDPETPYEYRYTGLGNGNQPQVYVDNLNIDAGGVLSIGLSPETTIGHYGQVFAANVGTTGEDGVIAGSLKAHFIPGKYGNPGATWVYDSVVNSPDINGGDVFFSNVYSNTPLIDVSATYTGDHVNLVATRVSFEDAADNTNRKSVGAAVDSFYSDLNAPTFETGNYQDGNATSFDDLIASIFALDGTQAYEDMMDKLSAEPYAQQLNQALTSFDGLQNLLLDRVTNGGGGSGGALGYGEEKTAANSPASNAIVTASLPPQPKADFWARGFGDWQSQSDPSSALAYSGSQAGGYIGGDMYAAPNVVVGAAAGLTSSSMRFDNGDHISNTGFQVAGYGRWDGGAWYVRGFGGYGQYTNDSTRIVPILMTPTEMKGGYDTKVAGGYAELGYKGFEGPKGGFIPFAGLSATWASNSAFTETGGSASLDVAAANATRVASSFGGEVIWNTVVGTTPFEALVRAAWEHVWTGSASAVDASFINAPGPSNGFTSTSALAGDLAAVTASGTWKVAPMSSLTAQYDGKFGSGFVDTTISGVFKQQF